MTPSVLTRFHVELFRLRVALIAYENRRRLLSRVHFCPRFFKETREKRTMRFSLEFLSRFFLEATAGSLASSFSLLHLLLLLLLLA